MHKKVERRDVRLQQWETPFVNAAKKEERNRRRKLNYKIDVQNKKLGEIAKTQQSIRNDSLELENARVALEDEKANDVAHEPASLIKVGLAFAPNLRMVVYGLLNAHVSTTNMKMVIVHTARAFGIEIEDDELPSCSMCSEAVSTQDSPAIEPRSNPGSGKILMSEKSQAVYYISSCHVLIDKVLSSD